MWNEEDLDMETDRISLLPDCLLHDILSYLDTRQVIQTSVLSKRWKTLWKNIPFLNFDYYSYPFEDAPNRKTSIENIKSFHHFISKVLSQHHSPYIKKTSFSLPKYSARDFSLLFLYRSSQQLHITTCRLDEWIFYFYACDLLTSLEICCRYVYRLEDLQLPSLRNLVIERLLDATFWKVDDYENECTYKHWNIRMNDKTFSGCPKLESLVLVDCVVDGGRVFAPKLENLELINNGSSRHKLVVFPRVWLCTPNLRSVKFKNVLPCLMSTTTCSTSEFVCIDKVYVQVVDEYDFERNGQLGEMKGNISQLLRAFHNASSFTLPSIATEVIFKVPTLLSGCSFNNLRHLKFRKKGTCQMIDLPICINTISDFIECPKLQTFAVDSTITGSLSHLNLQEDKF